MFPLEQGAFEMILIGAIALIVVGPKDLPMLMRKVGQFTAKMRGLAAEFRASFDEMARQSELDELRKEVDALRTGQFLEPSYPEPTATVVAEGTEPLPELTAAGPLADSVEVIDQSPPFSTPASEGPAKPSPKKTTKAKLKGLSAPPKPSKPRARKAKAPPAAENLG